MLSISQDRLGAVASEMELDPKQAVLFNPGSLTKATWRIICAVSTGVLPIEIRKENGRAESAQDSRNLSDL